MRATAFSIAALASLVTNHSPASSADYTFNVPVDLENLPAVVKSYSVACQVTDNNANTGTNAPWTSFGFGVTNNIALPPGQKTVKATHTIAFNYDPNLAKSAADAKWYLCTLTLCTDVNTCAGARLPGTTAASQGPAWSVAAPNSGSVVQVGGPLPKK